VLADESRYVRDAMLGRLTQASYTGRSGQVASLGAGGPQVAALDAQAMTVGSDEPMTVGYDDKSLAAPQSYGPSLVFWTNAFGAWADFDGNKNAASADRNLGGFVSGMDAHVAGSWRLGLVTGASFSDISVDARHSGADVDSFHLGGYAGGAAGPLALRGGRAWTWNDIDTSRAVIFPGFFEREKASYGADTGQIFGEVAYPTAMGAITLEPFADIAGVSIDTDSFKEHGGALSALRGRSVDEDVGYSTVGLRLGTIWHWCDMVVVPHASAAWQHAFDDVTPEAALAFASTGIGFTITGVPLAQDSALIDAGLDFALGPGMTLGASYSGQIASDLTDNAVKGRFTWLF
jgi:outer membrane autotransporter protein